MKYLILIMLFFSGIIGTAGAQESLLRHEMIFVEGGTFQMGSNSIEENQKPVHSVTLSAFNIGKYEVTQAQWKAVMGSNPSYFKDCDQCPVEQVSWDDVHDFIRKLNAKTGKRYYRLPTEAEWEYAARGGKNSNGYAYSGSNDLDSVAWYTNNRGHETHAVGSKQANELGIYDMTGNVNEWCSDWRGPYNSYNETNPTGASSAFVRVLRGGSLMSDPNECLTAFRDGNIPDYSSFWSGFRLVLPIEDQPKAVNQSNTIEIVKEWVPYYAEQLAEFPGGEIAMLNFISDNIVYPETPAENEILRRVIVKFDVDIDGTVGNITIERGVPGGHSLEQAVIDVCKQFPKFSPAMQNGKPIKSYFLLPINFKL
jgi:TonB family protein